MSDLIPGRRRGWATRDDRAIRSATPAQHVDLGRLWRRRHSLRHVVTQTDADAWVTACTGTPAVRSFLGRPDQATCAACRRQIEEGAA